MGLKRFDRKFGASLLRELPEEPAVYLFKDEEGQVIYAGKAKNIRRRLRSYRNASRRKAHRKMRTLVREASSLEVRVQPSEHDALLLENELIRTLRPSYNVDGAFSFLYPAIGTAVVAHQTLLCITTRRQAFSDLPMRWHGSFRSRLRSRDAFERLVSLLDRLGHREPASRLPGPRRPRGSWLVGYRRLEELRPPIDRFLSGESPAVLRTMSLQLLERSAARREAEQVGEALRGLDAFFESDTRPLREAQRAAGRRPGYVDQDERDALFIAFRRREDAP